MQRRLLIIVMIVGGVNVANPLQVGTNSNSSQRGSSNRLYKEFSSLLAELDGDGDDLTGHKGVGPLTPLKYFRAKRSSGCGQASGQHNGNFGFNSFNFLTFMLLTFNLITNINNNLNNNNNNNNDNNINALDKNSNNVASNTNAANQVGSCVRMKYNWT